MHSKFPLSRTSQAKRKKAKALPRCLFQVLHRSFRLLLFPHSLTQISKHGFQSFQAWNPCTITPTYGSSLTPSSSSWPTRTLLLISGNSQSETESNICCSRVCSKGFRQGLCLIRQCWGEWSDWGRVGGFRGMHFGCRCFSRSVFRRSWGSGRKRSTTSQNDLREDAGQKAVDEKEKQI